MKTPDIAILETTIGYRFHQPELLQLALMHSSRAREMEAATPERRPVRDNEQLEFLGDAVLGFVTSDALYRRFPGFEEGQLSKLRAHLVSGKHLARVAQQLQLGDYLALGRGEERSGGRGKAALLVNALEAMVAALYLDGGLEQARQFVVDKVLEPELEQLRAGTNEGVPLTDYKSSLQEAVYSTGHAQPAYVLVKEEGPDHRKMFTVEARLHRVGAAAAPEFVAQAVGPTKKRAEQDAARLALEYLHSLPAPTPEPPAGKRRHSRAI
jgi:ribonuclease-3